MSISPFSESCFENKRLEQNAFCFPESCAETDGKLKMKTNRTNRWTRGKNSFSLKSSSVKLELRVIGFCPRQLKRSAFLGYMKTLLFLFVIIYSASVVCLAQNDFATVNADLNACELNSFHFDMIYNELANNPLAKVTAKFYAGKSENNITSKKRADYVEKFLQQYKGFDPSRLEFVDSGKLDTDENPKIEFYIAQSGEVEGKLFLLTYAQPNRTPCLDCCEDERVFPQYIGSKPKKKKMTKQKKKRKTIKTRRTNQWT